MPTLIPDFSTCSQRMTYGERRFAKRLEKKLEDDCLIWYNVPIGQKRIYPDFIILHPQRGIIILEVKDWKLSTIQRLDSLSVTLLTPEGEINVDNPLEQARNYALAVNHLLKPDNELIHKEGRYRGSLVFPYSYGVVLTNITRRQLDAANLEEVLPSKLVICQDEMYENVDAINFQQRLWNLCTYNFGEPLTSVQIDRVRWHLFPEIRIGKQLSLFPDEPVAEEDASETIIPDILQVMDLQQEQLARSLGIGHRVVHGVAGSGKTLILVYRCLYLEAQTQKPILVLCFNVTLAAKLRSMLQEKGVSDRVAVRHFHGWCSDLLKQHRIPRPSPNEFSGEAYIKELVQRVIQAVEQGRISTGQYGAVLIDEGHDFEPDWFKLVVQMVDLETKSLLLLYDDAQNLYRERRTVNFKSVGIQAQGRTTILKVNYRNTQEVLTFAYEFAKETFAITELEDEDVPMIVQPASVGRRGVKPELVHLSSFAQETNYLVERVKQFHEQGTPWNEIAIVYRSRFRGEKIYQWLQQAQVPVEWINRNQHSRNYNPHDNSLKLVTMQSSKGLEFPVVLVSGVGGMPIENAPEVEEARLLYVAMTRSIEQLILTCNRRSRFVARLETALHCV